MCSWCWWCVSGIAARCIENADHRLRGQTSRSPGVCLPAFAVLSAPTEFMFFTPHAGQDESGELEAQVRAELDLEPPSELLLAAVDDPVAAGQLSPRIRIASGYAIASFAALSELTQVATRMDHRRFAKSFTDATDEEFDAAVRQARQEVELSRKKSGSTPLKKPRAERPERRPARPMTTPTRQDAFGGDLVGCLWRGSATGHDSAAGERRRAIRFQRSTQ